MRLKTNARLLAQLPALCWTADENFVLTSSFGGMLDRVGSRQGILTGKSIREIFAGERAQHIQSAHEHALMGAEAAFDFVWHGRTLHAQLSPIFAPSGEINGVIGVAVDATDGAKLEEALKKTQTALATAEYVAHLGSWSHDHRTGEIWWSEELYRILDVSPDQTPHKRDGWGFDHPQDIDLIELTIAHATSQQMPYSIEQRIVGKSGDVRIGLGQGSFAFDHVVNRLSEVGTLLDVTDRARTQTTLAKMQRSVTDAQQAARMGTWDANLKTGDIWWSGELYNILGLEHTVDLKLGELWKFDHPDDRERVKAAIEEARSRKEPYSVVYRVLRADGRERRVLERGADFFDWLGERVRNVGVVIDITDESLG